MVSLAAALFGILAKQWIREYLLWNSPLAAPRENVLVRQMQFETWETWNVEATIAAVPALLEVAMILFLLGLAVLLWTLDDIVAIAVTAAVALFLLIVSAFTILPVLFHRCPYRSPTAWACLAGCNLLYSSFISCLVASRSIFRTFRAHLDILCPSWTSADAKPADEPNQHRHLGPAHAKDWRGRDLASLKATRIRAGRWWSKWHDLRALARSALVCESRYLDEHGEEIVRMPRLPVRISDGAVEALLVDVAETTHLIQALSWVDRASQDARTSAFVAQCVDDIHSPLLSDIVEHHGVRMATDWHVIMSFRHGLLDKPHASMVPLAQDLPLLPLNGLRRSIGVWTSGTPPTSHALHRSPYNLIVNPGPSQSPIFSLLVRLIAADLKASARMPSEASIQQRRILELYTVLQTMTEHGTLRETGWYLEALEALMNIETTWPPGFLGEVFFLACKYGKATASSEGLISMVSIRFDLPRAPADMRALA